MRRTPRHSLQLSHHQELQQSVFELWELSARTRTLWLFSRAPWPAVASPRASATVPETMGLTPWECALLQGSRPPPEKTLSGHWERRSHRWPHTLGVALWEGTECEAQLAQAQRKEREKQWLNQFAESAAAQGRDSERRRHLHKNYGSMTMF